VVVDDPNVSFSTQSMKADIEQQLQEAKRLFEAKQAADVGTYRRWYFAYS
jgi:hypothetical protein